MKHSINNIVRMNNTKTPRIDVMDEKGYSSRIQPNNRFGLSGIFGDHNIFTYPVPTSDYVIYIDDLSELEEHQERLQLIRQASPEDTIRIIINSPGGYVKTAMSYVHAIRESVATIGTHAEGEACSAGTILWLACENRTVAPMTSFMFHNYQGGVFGNGANINSHVAHYTKYFNRIIDSFYTGVLTQEEIDLIKNGGEVWLDEVELCERTQATLLTKENITKLQNGIPLTQCDCADCQKEEKPEGVSEEEEQQGKEVNFIQMVFNLPDGEGVIFNAMTVEEEDLEDFSDDELRHMLLQLMEVELEESVNEDLHELVENATRTGLVATFLWGARQFEKIVKGKVETGCIELSENSGE